MTATHNMYYYPVRIFEHNVSLLDTGHSFDVITAQEKSAVLTVDINLKLYIDKISDTFLQSLVWTQT